MNHGTLRARSSHISPWEMLQFLRGWTRLTLYLFALIPMKKTIQNAATFLLAFTMATAPTVAQGQLVPGDRHCPRNAQNYLPNAAQTRTMQQRLRAHLGSTPIREITAPTVYQGWGHLYVSAGRSSQFRQFVVGPQGAVIEVTHQTNWERGSQRLPQSVAACLKRGDTLFGI
ncbi:MAG: hypothetical protein Fur0042_05540 [Cyanophyceae cyanobacterium]